VPPRRLSLSPDQITAVVLAGGLGTRVRSVAPGIPKPMIPVEGRPFLEWIISYLAGQGIRRVIVSTGYQAEMIERHFTARPPREAVVRCVREGRALGTAGGARLAIRSGGWDSTAWLILNGDSLALTALGPMFGLLEEPETAGVLLGVSVADASRYGRMLADTEGRLVGFEEKRPGPGTISAGVYLLRARLVDDLPDRTPMSFETEVFPLLTGRRVPLKVLVCDAPFLDIGTPESLRQAGEFIRQGRRFFPTL
jgi:D-glycero-alpha-D-manno-heptose 1-phosphate guanylyltransferase